MNVPHEDSNFGALTIRAEEPRDRARIFAVHASAFPTDAEAKLVDALRDGGFARVSLVAEIDGEIVGHILFSDLAIVNDAAIGNPVTTAAIALAPLAVLPGFQRRGIGSALIRRGLDACRTQGHRIVIVLGEPSYYGRFGFSAALTGGLLSPYQGDYFMAAELETNALTGISGRVEYPPPFTVF